MTQHYSDLGDVCSFLNGGTHSKSRAEYYGGDIPWITGADILDGQIATPRTYITQLGLQKSSANLAEPGSVLLVTRTSVGKVAKVPIPLSFSQDITALIPDPSRLDADYLVHFLRTNAARLAGAARGATIKGVTRSVVEGLRVPLPPLPEQRRIAAILDHADALRAKRRETIARLDEFTESILFDLLRSCLLYTSPSPRDRG